MKHKPQYTNRPDVKDVDFRTVGVECGGCPNNCEIVCVLKENRFLDAWGNRCPAGSLKAQEIHGGPTDKTRRRVKQVDAVN